ncbi:MAG: right-handed parallel beta-helix repeat-containing protein [Deltaproteobacteria bacterium]|nr:right-handed parallel beta-helix repeat-containing protein [Deltaproteobacteria bacterium]
MAVARGESGTVAALALVVAAAMGCGGGNGGSDAGGDDGSGRDTADVPPAATELRMISIRAVAITSTSAILGWYTYVPATSQVDYGADEAYGTTTTEDGELVAQHRVALTGLSAVTEYHFRVRSRTDTLGPAESEDHVFRTLPGTCVTGDGFFVDGAAAAGGDGTSWETAWGTPDDIDETALGPGDCVTFRGGTYADALRLRAAAGGEGNPITVLAAGPVVLTGGVQVDEGVHDVVIRGFELTWSDTATRGPGVELDGDRITFVDNYLHHTSGISLDGDGNVARNNLVWYAEGVAMVVAGTGSSLEDNDVSRSVCFFAGDADTSRFFGTGNAIRDNFFHDVFAEDSAAADCHPHCDCFQTYSVNPGEEAHDITIEGNTCFDICGQMFMGEGILADDTAADITFRDNVFERVGAVAMNAGGIRNLRLEHNTFVGGGLSAIGISDCPGATITSNIFYENPHAYGCDGCPADWNLVWPYDCFFDPFPEAHGLHGVDPLFVDPVDHDFQPLPGSPACGGGEGGTQMGALPCDPVAGCTDHDGDGYGRPAAACVHPEQDCDDEDDEASPGLAEICDGKDNDCDGLTEEDCAEPLSPYVLDLELDGDIADSSGNGLWTEWEGGTGTFVEGHDGGQALALGGGEGPHVLVADDARLRGMGMLTISVWARKNAADGGGVILLKHVYYMLGVRGDSVDAYVQTPDGGIDLDVYHYAAVNDTAWHHYEITYDSRTGQARLLVDDVEASSGTGSGFIRDEPCDPRDVSVGDDPWGDTFDGAIDEVRISDWVP